MPDPAEKIVVVGASGSLGTVLTRLAVELGTVVPVSHTTPVDGGIRADMTDATAAARALDEAQPDCLINLAAKTDVDACERDEAEADRLNTGLCRNLANWCATAQRPVRLVHVSTDQVYSGTGPHAEDAAAPLNVYARSKLAGEQEILKAPNSVVLRTNFFNAGPDVGRGLAAWLLKALATQSPIRVFEDILFNPLYAGDLSAMILKIMRTGATGVFNVGANDGVSKAEFARLLAGTYNLSLAKAVAGSSDDSGLGAARPKDMRMNISKVATLLGQKMPSVQQGLDAMFKDTQALGWQPKVPSHV